MKSPLVVGYKGEIGSFILQGLLRVMPKACDIWCVDIGDSHSEVLKRIKKADVIFLCVPIQNTVQWFIDWAEELKDKVIVEQTSLKSILFEDPRFIVINKEYKFNIMSMHILFRPSATPNLQDRKIALIDYIVWGGREGFERPMNEHIIQSITQSNWFDYSNYKQHDNDMAYKQALVHRVLINLDAILDNNFDNTFLGGKIHELAVRIKNGDHDLYKLIQTNSHAQKALKEFKENLNKFLL